MSSPSLRRLVVGDEQEVLKAFIGDVSMDRQGGVASLGQARAYVERLASVDAPHLAWAVVDEDDRLCGLVAVTVELDDIGWFWYWMAKSHRGRGWTSRAAATVASWALDEVGLHRLELGHRADNPASGVVAQRAGFVREGIQREKFLVDGQRVDAVSYSRLRSDPWPALEALPMR